MTERKPMSRDEMLVCIINHYGIKHQEEKAVEEMAELTKELVKKWHCHDREEGIQLIRNIREEVADVYVMMLQLMKLCDEELVMEIVDEKIKRTVEEMQNE